MEKKTYVYQCADCTTKITIETAETLDSEIVCPVCCGTADLL